MRNRDNSCRRGQLAETTEFSNQAMTGQLIALSPGGELRDGHNSTQVGTPPEIAKHRLTREVRISAWRRASSS